MVKIIKHSPNILQYKIERKPLKRRNFGISGKDYFFVETYLSNGMNAREALKKVGYKGTCLGTAKRILSKLSVQQYMEKRKNELSRAKYISFDYKIKKLSKLLDLAIPESARSIKDTSPTAAVSAISELNKMQGHYSAEKHVNVNVDLDPDLKVVDELIKEYEKPY